MEEWKNWEGIIQQKRTFQNEKKCILTFKTKCTASITLNQLAKQKLKVAMTQHDTD